MRALFTFSLLLIFALSGVSTAQGQCARWGRQAPKWELRTGLGLLSTFQKDRADQIVPPLSLEVRYRPAPAFSLGLFGGGSVNSATLEHHSGSSMRVRNQFRMVALRAAAHAQRWTRWEPYGGVSLAYQHTTVQALESQGESTAAIHYAPRKTGFFYGAFVGTCYQPTDRMEIFGELGYGLSILTLGVGFSW